MNNQNVDQLPLGGILLSVFPPALRRAVVEFVISSPDALQASARIASEHVQLDPALGFLREDLPPSAVVNILRALTVVLRDALAGQWDVDQYTLALVRAASVPANEARKLVTEEIVTQDAGILSFARRSLLSIPDLPGPIDEIGKGVLGGVLNIIDSLVPLDWVNSSGDVLYEWYRMGKVLGELAIRSKLTLSEVAFEKAPITEGSKVDLKEAALESLPLLAKAVVGLAMRGFGAGDVDDGSTRDEVRELAAEVGDLYTEAHYLRPEEGSFGSFLKKVGRTAGKIAKTAVKVGLPIVSTVVPGASLATSALTKVLGGAGNAAGVRGAAARADDLPRPNLQLKGSVSLSSLYNAVRSLQNTGVDVSR